MTVIKMQPKKCFLLLLTFALMLMVFFLINKNSPINDVDRTNRLKKIDELIRSKASMLACKQPDLPVDAEEMMKFVHRVPPINCSGAPSDTVKCEGSVCTIQENVKPYNGPIRCDFTDLIRKDDFQSTEGETSTSYSSYILEKSDVVHVKCYGKFYDWSATLTGIRRDKNIYEDSSWDGLPENALKMNILMFGFDSLSRNSFIRKLPKSYEYMTETLNTLILKGYNIVGDGTPQALIPLLTGKTELELPDTRKRMKESQFVNSYPFIWNDYKRSGYVTAFFEDVPQLSTFTYRLNGFKEAPTDHYMRPYYLASFEEQIKWPKYCTGDVPRHQIMFKQIENFFRVYKDKPKFLFGFHGELSHDDYNLIEVVDLDFRNFLKTLFESDILKNTILIIMADHGHRFAEIRNTLQGKQEERLPFFSFTFPSTFAKTHKKAYENFKRNLDKLTTPFDIHETLKSALNLENTDLADIGKRAVSLFSEIPPSRSCAHAYIEPHWCACLDWNRVPLKSPMAYRLAEALVEKLNNVTQSYRNICDLLYLSKIEWVTKLVANENLLKFKKNADFDGFVADLSAKMNIEYDMYQIKIIVQPGDSIFEASIRHLIRNNELQINLDNVSRINLYGRQARCVENDLPDLRKYCHCK